MKLISKLCDDEFGDFKFEDSEKLLLIPAWKNEQYQSRDGPVERNINVSVF